MFYGQEDLIFSDSEEDEYYSSSDDTNDQPDFLQSYQHMGPGTSRAGDVMHEENIVPGSYEAFIKRIVGAIAGRKLIGTGNLEDYVKGILSKLSDEQIVLLNDELTIYALVFIAQRKKLNKTDLKNFENNVLESSGDSGVTILNLIRYIKLFRM